MTWELYVYMSIRYGASLEVEDETGKTTLVVFDNQAQKFFKVKMKIQILMNPRFISRMFAIDNLSSW